MSSKSISWGQLPAPEEGDGLRCGTPHLKEASAATDTFTAAERQNAGFFR